MKKAGFRIILLIILLFSCAGLSFALNAGSLDTTFGTGGIASHRMSPGGGYFGSMAIQTDGKVILGGTWNDEFGLVRFNTNGSLDTTFGTNGVVKTQVQNGGSTLADIIISPDGKIIAAGRAIRRVFIPTKPGVEYYYEFAAVRYNANGSLDTTFSDDGKATIYANNGPANLYQSVALQPDDKVVVTGYISSEAIGFVIVRFNADGSIDTSFDGDGVATTAFDTGAVPEDVKILPDGKILVAGHTASGFQVNSKFLLARYNANGSLDATFDGDGRVVTTIDGNDSAFGLILLPDGKFIAAGVASTSFDSNQRNVALARYNTGGSLDTTFDGDGKVSASFAFPVVALDAVRQTDGKIVAAGWSFFNQSVGFAVVRFLPNGAADTSFDGDGVITTGITGGGQAEVVAITSGGKIIAGGASYNGSGADLDLVAVRYNANAGTFADFDGDSKTDISIYRPSNGQWWLNRSSDGIYATPFGGAGDRIVPADYTGDGKTDIAFWRPSNGLWFVLRSEDGSFFSHPFGASGDIPAPADFDGDGKADEAVFRPSTATWYVLRSSGGTTIQQFGANGDVPVVADYDGDGKSDIAIYRAASGEWWIQRSTAGLIAFQFGNNSDKPVAGDYTGDGKADVAFFRPSTNEWFVLRSENQSYYSFAFGTAGDIPAPGDYDGDGRFDATVFRPSTNTWYSQRTTAGTLIQSFGQNGDTPVPSAFVP